MQLGNMALGTENIESVKLKIPKLRSFCGGAAKKNNQTVFRVRVHLYR